MNFKLNPSDYLGNDHEVFKTHLMELALSDPKTYFGLRKDVLQAVKKESVDSIYSTYYYLLTKGQKNETDSILLKTTSESLAGSFVPSVPMQKVNEFALKASKTIDAIAEEAIEMILPADYRMIAENRVVQKTASNLGFASK